MKYSSEEIGKQIKNNRLLRNWTQEKLGNKLNVSGKQISNYEKGIQLPPIDILFKLCEIFGCELGYLLCEEAYKSGTKLDTAIEKKFGLNTSTLEAILHITGTDKKCLNFGYESDNYKRILNHLLSNQLFFEFMNALFDLDSCIQQMNNIWNKLEKKYNKDALDQAYKYYCSTTDYFHDDNTEKLPDIFYQAMNDIDSSIDKEHDISFNLKVLRYETRESFERLLNSLYPSHTE